MIVSEEGFFKKTPRAKFHFPRPGWAARAPPRGRGRRGLAGRRLPGSRARGPPVRVRQARFARLRLVTQSPRLRVSQADHDDHRRGLRVGFGDSGSESLAA
jgi:hypothetical protein